MPVDDGIAMVAAHAAALGSQLVWVGAELDKACAAAQKIRRALGEEESSAEP